MVEDEVAQKLEAAGLWRRAASRWFYVIQHHALTDWQRDRIRQHRKYGLSCAKPISSPEKLDVTEITRAANAAQERMGLSQPDGEAFRLKDREKTDRSGVRNESLLAVDGVVSGNDPVENERFTYLHGIDIKPENAEEAS